MPTRFCAPFSTKTFSPCACLGPMRTSPRPLSAHSHSPSAEFAPLPPFYTVQSRPGNPHAPFALASDPSSSPPSLNLGVPLALVKPIYTIARTRFWEARRALEEQIVAIADREGEARHGHALENAPSTCPVCELGEDATASLASSSLLLLLVHAEDPTPWNVRRRIFLHSFHCSLPGPPSKHDVDLHTRTIRTASAHQELAASALVLSRHPGSSAAWSYRRWLLTTITTTQNLHLPTFTPSALLPTELRLTLRAAEKKHSNYLAWGHRGWALQWAVGGCDVGGGGARDDAVVSVVLWLCCVVWLRMLI
ncbi:hypothetical protein M427DRAFT_312122 [Gonapodya prolifera JEL478]|uniref:Protein prenylyltransferase n=1 Tax=Gonapodya prolifera (strain JEL478) TaxID=1344416 RepID=A0A139AWN8_GONPJ|nr:hypothetical protein M427DRAFT_312122 [Gonapodya prolifera JEL478]|eukprot:KXS21138.1 hypothetical protein M427DRAFT_312122 [Gonapodya prolifera JEL478]